jgi:hypothetical protein
LRGAHERQTDNPQDQKQKRKVIFKRADQYVKEYISAEKEEIRLQREARKTGDFYVPAQPKVYFVVRLKGYVLSLLRYPGGPMLRCLFGYRSLQNLHWTPSAGPRHTHTY